ncbi:SRS domain-containing protein [Neospora caninum Liverpool]|uniref:SRS domain-containing protein n=3 Tax=Neospora caninum TaxID=29176 RepID=F0VIH4_NEOCL|nr:SRS domain-containing protein [Neospora caninum Liverpool]AAD25091.1 surface antigen SAG1 [Neospora caninum]CBZ53535.1 SRS domain-containing protein [Neospora caninum Liverpool]CEL67523.1 TPA: SRS domain-containing protein [Neospora caninum Liverpool]|eukprot:XP_003883567.1 SRS domain-containing protein [Neospora caninum Liverpool]
MFPRAVRRAVSVGVFAAPALVAFFDCGTMASEKSPLLVNQVVTCDNEEKSSVAVLLSPKLNHITLKCPDNSTAVPAALGYPTNRTVCPAESGGQTCTGKEIPLESLLPGANDSWWSGVDIKTGVKLTIPEASFPTTSKSFDVGCVSSDASKSCMVTVTVPPRASSLVNGVAMCSYGANETLGPITLSEGGSSTMTLVCGTDGKPVPPDPKQVCSGTTVKDCKAKPFTDVFPKFSADWWQGKPDTKDGAKLTIKKGAFPPKEEKFTLGCKSVSSPEVYCTVQVEAERASAGIKSSAENVGRVSLFAVTIGLVGSIAAGVA